jgi:hypothetical protein
MKLKNLALPLVILASLAAFVVGLVRLAIELDALQALSAPPSRPTSAW